MTLPFPDRSSSTAIFLSLFPITRHPSLVTYHRRSPSPITRHLSPPLPHHHLFPLAHSASLRERGFEISGRRVSCPCNVYPLQKRLNPIPWFRGGEERGVGLDAASHRKTQSLL